MKLSVHLPFVAILICTVQTHKECVLNCGKTMSLAIANVTEAFDQMVPDVPLKSMLEIIVQPVDSLGRLKKRCSIILTYRDCLAKCDRDTASRILTISITPWIFICRRHNIEDLSISLPCLTNHAKRMINDCFEPLKSINASLQQMQSAQQVSLSTVNSVCRAQDEFEQCFLDAVQKYCADATLFFRLLSHTSRSSLLDLWQLYLTQIGGEKMDLPGQCLRLRFKRYDPKKGTLQENFAQQIYRQPYYQSSDGQIYPIHNILYAFVILVSFRCA